MKNRIITSILVVVIVVNCVAISDTCFAAAADDRWDGRDKVVHLFAGFAGYTITYNYLTANTELSEFQAKTVAVCSVLAIGALKESLDDEFSWKDMGANATGVGIGIVVNFEF